MGINWSAAFAVVMDLLSSDFGRSIVGVLVGGSITLIAARMQIRSQSRDAERKEEATQATLRRGVAEELKNLRALHVSGILDHIEDCRDKQGNPDGDHMFAQFYPIFSDYFTLFTSNAHLIGTLQTDSAASVIRAYIDLKAMVDTFRMNNAMLSRLEGLEILLATHAGVSALRDEIVSLRDQLNDYGPSVVRSHDRAMASADKAIRVLEGVGA